MKKYSVYVLKCQQNKYWVGFSGRRLDEYFDIIKNGNGPKFARIYLPLSIISISSFEDIDDAKAENVKVYEILSSVIGGNNVAMDEKRYNEIKNKHIDIDINIQNLKPGTFEELEMITCDDTPNFNLPDENHQHGTNFQTPINVSNDKYIAYCLICTKNARYIGMTRNLKQTMALHEEGKIEFTRAYKPKKIEFEEHCNREINAKISQIDILDRLRFKHGNDIRIYTEFINSKPNMKIVWEDIVPPANEELFENTPDGNKIKFWVYVLECEESKYYVGYTSNLRKRFKKHVSGSGGSNFTYYYHPICVHHIEGYSNAVLAQKGEQVWTLDLKKIKGRENVFGFWAKTDDPKVPMYLGHELLKSWTIKNTKALEI